MDEYSKQGYKFAEVDTEGVNFDKNVITPGTEFMTWMSNALQFYILQRLNYNSHWKGLKVILSDSSVPGEGEHKILDYIWGQRVGKGYNPNMSHCIYGADADLIMLGLATHELKFYIIREKQDEPNRRDAVEKKESNSLANYQFVSLKRLWEYLNLEFSNLDIGFPFDIERLIDDFVFLCFFVGNDFLPHLPCLRIREGAIDLMYLIYKNVLPKIKDYLTKSCKLIISNIDVFF